MTDLRRRPVRRLPHVPRGRGRAVVHRPAGVALRRSDQRRHGAAARRRVARGRLRGGRAARCAATCARSPPRSLRRCRTAPRSWCSTSRRSSGSPPAIAVISPDEAIDLLSSAMAAIEPVASVGVHCCADIDVALLLDAGPHVVSLPVSTSVVPLAGYLDRFLARGGWIAWGAVATEGPIGVTANRSWHQLASVWTQLIHRGCDPERLQRPVHPHPAVRPGRARRRDGRAHLPHAARRRPGWPAATRPATSCCSASDALDHAVTPALYTRP